MKRIISLFLAFCICMITGVAVSADESVWQELDYTESEQVVTQSDSGVAEEILLCSTELDGESAPRNDSGFVYYTVSLKKWSGGAGYTDGDIDDWFLDYLRESLAALRENGGACIIRCTYQVTEADMMGPLYPDNFDTLLGHVSAVGTVVSEYADTVIAVEDGMIGSYSGMAMPTFHIPEYQNQVIGAWLDSTSETVAVILDMTSKLSAYINSSDVFKENFRLKTVSGVTYPSYIDSTNFYKYSFEGTELARLGIADGYMLSDHDHGGVLIPSAESVGSWLTGVFYGGKFAYINTEDNRRSPAEAVEWLYSASPDFLRTADKSYEKYTEWQGVTVGDVISSAPGGADLSDVSDMDLGEFVVSHFGYRIVLRESTLSSEVAKGGVLKLAGAVDNTGFSGFFRKKCVDIVIYDGVNTYSVSTDVDAAEWTGGSKNSFEIDIKLPADIQEGECSVYMRVADESGVGDVKFANNGDIYDPDMRGNYLGSFTVSGDVVPGSDSSAKQVYTAFNDVTDGYWGEEAISDICALGYMGGVGVGIFRPEDVATRAQFVTILYRLEGSPDVSGLPNPFDDVAEGKWYINAVKWAYGEGIVNGTSAVCFSPDTILNRETFATMLYRYARYKGDDVSAQASLSKYSDVSEISSWSLTALSWANAEGYINGVSAVSIDPKGNATRAQTATILMRYIER